MPLVATVSVATRELFFRWELKIKPKRIPGLTREIKLRSLGAALLLFLSALSGCRPASAGASTGFPMGVYAIDSYRLEFQGSHFALLTAFGQEVAQGSFTLSGNRIQFTETDAAPECSLQYSPYSYQWSFDGKLLAFSQPDDRCASRPDFLMGSPWKYLP